MNFNRYKLETMEKCKFSQINKKLSQACKWLSTLIQRIGPVCTGNIGADVLGTILGCTLLILLAYFEERFSQIS